MYPLYLLAGFCNNKNVVLPCTSLWIGLVLSYVFKFSYFLKKKLPPFMSGVLVFFCEPMWGGIVRWTVVPQPTRVQVLVLAFISGFISGFLAMRIQWEETFPSTTRHLRWLRKSQDDMPAQSLGGAHRGRVCVCIFIGMSVCTCIWALASVLCSIKGVLVFSKQKS